MTVLRSYLNADLTRYIDSVKIDVKDFGDYHKIKKYIFWANSIVNPS